MTEISAEVNAWHGKIDAIERWLRPLFRRHSRLGGPAYFDIKDFPVAKTLSESHSVIRAEFDKARVRMDDFPLFQNISPEQVYISNDDKWKMFFLKSNNIRFEKNCEQFPETMKAVDSDPSIVSAYFPYWTPTRCWCLTRVRGLAC